MDVFEIPVGAHAREGLSLQFNLSAETIQRSPVWQTAGRRLCFFYLPAFTSIRLSPGRNFIKTIKGWIDNIDQNSLAAPFAMQSTEVFVEQISTAAEATLLALVTLDESDSLDVVEPNQVLFEGESSELLIWKSFHQRYSQFFDFFDGKDCYMADGFHLLDENGIEMVYVNPWICGKGVDLSTHNHGNPPSEMSPAFAEIHWVLASGAKEGGMYLASDSDGDERTNYPMAMGEEHGPFYDRDDSGRPVIADNGAVQYPWHGWQGGQDESAKQHYDYILAFEINPDFVDACLN